MGLITPFEKLPYQAFVVTDKWRTCKKSFFEKAIVQKANKSTIF